MKSFKFLFVLFFLLYIVWPINNIIWAAEDVDTQTSIIVLSIPATCHLGITNQDQTKTLAQDGTAETAFEAGYTQFTSGKPTLTVSSNKNWKLTAKSSGFNTNGTYKKATSDLQLKDTGSNNVKNGFNSYKSLSDTDQEIASSASGVKKESHPLQYKILLDYSKDIPGTYTATVTYTLATQP